MLKEIRKEIEENFKLNYNDYFIFYNSGSEFLKFKYNDEVILLKLEDIKKIGFLKYFINKLNYYYNERFNSSYIELFKLLERFNSIKRQQEFEEELNNKQEKRKVKKI